MSHPVNDIWLERRAEWLDDYGCTERDVLTDEKGDEYIMDVVDLEPNEHGGIYSTKVYLPDNLQQGYAPDLKV